MVVRPPQIADFTTQRRRAFVHLDEPTTRPTGPSPPRNAAYYTIFFFSPVKRDVFRSFARCSSLAAHHLSPHIPRRFLPRFGTKSCFQTSPNTFSCRPPPFHPFHPPSLQPHAKPFPPHMKPQGTQSVTKPQKHKKKMTRQTSSSMKIPSSHEIRPQRNLTSDIPLTFRLLVLFGNGIIAPSLNRKGLRDERQHQDKLLPQV